MSKHATLAGTIRKLRPTETDKFRDHLLRLDKESRRLRFGHGVSDSFIQEYAAHATEHGAVLFGYFEDGVMRASAELRKVGDALGQEAEAAFSVEPGYQEKGLGTELMGSVIRAARNRGVHLLFMRCLGEKEQPNGVSRSNVSHWSGKVKARSGPPTPESTRLLPSPTLLPTDWLAGVSIGAVNSAIIAGNEPAGREGSCAPMRLGGR